MDFLKQGMDAYKQYEQSQNGGNQQQQQQGFQGAGAHQGQNPYDSVGVQGSAALNSSNNGRPAQGCKFCSTRVAAYPRSAQLLLVPERAAARAPVPQTDSDMATVDLDYDQIAQHASAESGHDSGLFSQALSFLNQGGNNTDVREIIQLD